MTKQPEALRLADELQRLNESRKPHITGAHGQQLGQESWRIVASGLALERINDAAAELRRLHALCEEQKRLLETAQDRLEYERDENSVEICDAITAHLRQHEGEKHEHQ